MTDPLQLFPARVALGRTKAGELIFATPEFLRALGKIFERVGGATGASTTDLATSDDEDSGLEELRAEQWKQNDAFAMAPGPQFHVIPADAVDLAPVPQFHVVPDTLIAEVSALREEVAQLRAQVEDISRGSLL